MSKVVERVRSRFAEQIIDLLLADLKEHKILPIKMLGPTSLSREQQLRERWLQIFDGHYKKRDLRAAETKSEQSQVEARMTMALCLMEVFLALDGVGPDVKKSFSLVLENPDGTATLNSMFDAAPFLQDLRTFLDVPPGFDAKKVAENVTKLGDMSSLRMLGLLESLCLDQIQEALGLPRDPITAEVVEDLLLFRAGSNPGEAEGEGPEEEWGARESD
jgi:hypothetical protein